MAPRAVLRLAAAAALVASPVAHAFVVGSGSGLVTRPPATLRAPRGAGIRMSDDKYGETRVQVITDIDDTVKSSGGLRLLGKLGVNIGPALGGLDTQYKRNDFYPGVFQFGAELAAYGLPPNLQPAPMAVLTARARELKVFLALKPKTKLVQRYREAAEKLFSEYGKGSASWGIDTEKTVLYGSVIEWIIQYRKGWRKFDNFQKLRAGNDDRVRYVLVGDTGEYDEECGERMVAECPELVRALFFHHVSEKEWVALGEQGLPLPADKSIDGVPVSYFRTYVGAARKAFRHGLMGPEELLRVIAQAQADLKSVPQDDLKWADLRRDVDVATIELGRALTKKKQDQTPPPAAAVTAVADPAPATNSVAAPKTAEERGWLDRLKSRVFG